MIALSPGMRDGVIAAGVPPEQVTLVPNASDLDLFSPTRRPAARAAGLGDGFVCTYFGTMGEANDLTRWSRRRALLAATCRSCCTATASGARS